MEPNNASPASARDSEAVEIPARCPEFRLQRAREKDQYYQDELEFKVRIRSLPSEFPSDDDESDQLHRFLLGLAADHTDLYLTGYDPFNRRPKARQLLAVKNFARKRCLAEMDGNAALVRYYELGFLALEYSWNTDLELIETVRRDIEMRMLGRELPRALPEGDDCVDES
ncbi:hypothetical protein QBC40DRAFT_260117 [Triangularia verruculosa]|uniref:Uncharacterized protein n=1 Tax=Triangularia verruculosa TaxID=2587418 RepID=A0AAN6X5K9_9PEZI|nr:hypothetical protein QBC40DRAFT_260117 [Triangularia verruculosa]